jgi:hypothetical protein
MNLKAIAASAGAFFIAAFAVLPAKADDYTCDSGPCIVKANRSDTYKVKIEWSGQGTAYDFYRLTVTPHGGGKSTNLKLRGGESGKATINLKHEGDYEFVLFGCQNDEPDCERSSEKVRMNLY